MKAHLTHPTEILALQVGPSDFRPAVDKFVHMQSHNMTSDVNKVTPLLSGVGPYKININGDSMVRVKQQH